MSSYPELPLSSNFNPSLFDDTTGSLTLAIADKRYVRIGSAATLLSLSVASSVTADSIIASTLTGTLQTGAQPNITSIGTLSLLTSNDILITNSGTGSVSRVKYVNSTNAATWEAGIRGSTTANNPNTFYWYKTGPGYLMALSTNGCLTLNKGVSLDSQSTYGLQSSEVNISGSGLYIGGTQVIDSSRNVSAIRLTAIAGTAANGNILAKYTSTLPSVSDSCSQSALTLYQYSTTNGYAASIAFLVSTNDSAVTIAGARIDGVRSGGSGISDLTFSTRNDLAVCNERMRILSSGNVGINTASPAYTLHVNGSLNSTSLYISGSQVTSNSTELNYLTGVTPGTAAQNKALVCDFNNDLANINNFTALNLTGTLQTSDQPNIQTVTTLNITGHDGLTAGLKLGGTLVTASASELNYVDTTAGSAQASKALVLDSNSSITGINSLSSTTLAVNATTAVDGTWLSRVLSSPIVGTTACRKNALTISSYSTTVNQNVGISFLVSTSDVSTTAPSAMIMNVRTGSSGIGDLAFSTRNDATTCVEKMRILANGNVGINTASPAYVLDINGSANVTSFYIGGTQVTSTATQLNYTNVTPGTASATKALVVDLNNDIANINNFTALNLTGTLQTAAQANVTSLGTLTALTVSGSVSYTSTTASTSETTGAFVCAGGIGVAGDSFYKGKVTIGDVGSLLLTNSAAGALKILRASSSVSMRLGSAETTGNAATIQWAYTSSNSSANALRVDFYGTNSSFIITNGNRVGVTVSAPICRLDLGSLAADRVISLFNNATDFYGFGANSSTVYYQSAATHQWFYGSTPTSTGTLAMTLNNSNRLGVGTVNPEGAIHAVGQIWTNDLFHSKVNSDSPIYTWRNSTVNYTAIGTYLNSTASIRLGTVNGSFAWVGYSPVFGGSYTNASDQRLKRDIVDIPYGLDEVMQLLPRKFVWKDSGLQSIGFIAQEMLPILSEPVSVPDNCDDLNEDGTPKNGMGIDYACLTSVLCKAIQELKKELEDLKALITQST